MGKHRLERPTPVRLRVGRAAAAGLALLVTAIALLGGVGLIPLGGAGTAATGNHTAARTGTSGSAAAGSSVAVPTPTTTTPAPTPSVAAKKGTAPVQAAPTTALPAGSGQGRRVVFSISSQRVWLVDGTGAPFSTYLVSGSLTDNLRPGSYAVYSRSRWAVGIDDSGVMQYFVRFARGDNAAIGFHSIPTKNGSPLQTEAQLGSPQSHGCIRQKLSDAERLWKFAGTGTAVVVTA